MYYETFNLKFACKIFQISRRIFEYSLVLS